MDIGKNPNLFRFTAFLGDNLQFEFQNRDAQGRLLNKIDTKGG